ncbi:MULTISPECIES: sensor histidine kinase [unclassified Corynebacterium]|uniref:sensor histidine kinase n=1 Tax=unclassified Corynebacterium TaxID=2624378 RepID=UPI0029C9F6F2|nr:MULTISPECIES: histidine kinase [unclassified Corynebacterium]WPF66774.1 histidine kinase [Corynebacterium sp. 22KM0430]WPF69262.1 histidine kinase [Corynebacterium sp. 21KM1197]
MPSVSRRHLHALFVAGLVLYIFAFLPHPSAGLALAIPLAGFWGLWATGRYPRAASLAFSLVALLGYFAANWVSSVAMLILAVLTLLLSLGNRAALGYCGVVVGVTAGAHLYAGSGTGRAFTEALAVSVLLGFGYAFAAQVRHGMVLNRRLHRHIATQQDLLLSRERERMARSLHDSLGHRLTAVLLRLDFCRRTLPPHAQLDRARAMTAQALDDMRATVRALTPVELREGDLTQALRTLAESFSATALRVQVSTLNTMQPPEPVALLALRFTQEALANVVCHSNAHSAHISLDIRDDGSPPPLPPATASPPCAAAPGNSAGRSPRTPRRRASRSAWRCHAGSAY